MKTKIIFSILLISILTGGIFAQDVPKTDKKKNKELVVVEIQTSAVCGMCKKRLEHDISFEKGVKSVDLNDETKVLTVKFKKGKNSKEKIKKAITKVGYDADEMPANKKAYDALPECCKKFNDPH
jgi:copper chaperone CopZ